MRSNRAFSHGARAGWLPLTRLIGNGRGEPRSEYTRAIRILTALAAGVGAIACGGADRVASPETPVVTSITVTPAAAPLFMTDTLQLIAVVLDQRGAEIAGRTVAWNSSNA